MSSSPQLSDRSSPSVHHHLVGSGAGFEDSRTHEAERVNEDFLFVDLPHEEVINVPQQDGEEILHPTVRSHQQLIPALSKECSLEEVSSSAKSSPRNDEDHVIESVSSNCASPCEEAGGIDSRSKCADLKRDRPARRVKPDMKVYVPRAKRSGSPSPPVMSIEVSPLLPTQSPSHGAKSPSATSTASSQHSLAGNATGDRTPLSATGGGITTVEFWSHKPRSSSSNSWSSDGGIDNERRTPSPPANERRAGRLRSDELANHKQPGAAPRSMRSDKVAPKKNNAGPVVKNVGGSAGRGAGGSKSTDDKNWWGEGSKAESPSKTGGKGRGRGGTVAKEAPSPGSQQHSSRKGRQNSQQSSHGSTVSSTNSSIDKHQGTAPTNQKKDKQTPQEFIPVQPPTLKKPVGGWPQPQPNKKPFEVIQEMLKKSGMKLDLPAEPVSASAKSPQKDESGSLSTSRTSFTDEGGSICDEPSSRKMSRGTPGLDADDLEVERINEGRLHMENLNSLVGNEKMKQLFYSKPNMNDHHAATTVSALKKPATAVSPASSVCSSKTTSSARAAAASPEGRITWASGWGASAAKMAAASGGTAVKEPDLPRFERVVVPPVPVIKPEPVDAKPVEKVPKPEHNLPSPGVAKCIAAQGPGTLLPDTSVPPPVLPTRHSTLDDSSLTSDLMQALGSEMVEKLLFDDTAFDSLLLDREQSIRRETPPAVQKVFIENTGSDKLPTATSQKSSRQGSLASQGSSSGGAAGDVGSWEDYCDEEVLEKKLQAIPDKARSQVPPQVQPGKKLAASTGGRHPIDYYTMPALNEDFKSGAAAGTTSAVQQHTSDGTEVDDLPRLAHMVEVFDFPRELRSDDISVAVRQLGCTAFTIKWVDDRHCLAIFANQMAARSALMSANYHPLIKLRALETASAQTRLVARTCASQDLAPTVPRPITNASMARRLVEGHLRMKTGATADKRSEELSKLKLAKGGTPFPKASQTMVERTYMILHLEQKIQAKQQREDIWEGKL